MSNRTERSVVIAFCHRVTVGGKTDAGLVRVGAVVIVIVCAGPIVRDS